VGNLSPQGASNSGSSGITTTSSDEDIVVTSTYNTVYSLDMNNYTDAVIVMYSASVSENVDYKIYGSPKAVGVLPLDEDESWVNIIDVNLEPAQYDKNTSRTLFPLQTFYESMTNRFRWIRIMMKSSSTNQTVKIWVRHTG